MPIRFYRADNLGGPDIDYLQAGSSMVAKAGDVIGISSTAPVGTALRRATAGQITAGGGIAGFLMDDVTTDVNGVAITPSPPSGVNPAVVPKLALTQYSDRLWQGGAIAGAQRSQVRYMLAIDGVYFIQRHKKGTRVNQSLKGIKCDFTWNTTTLEWEVDSTTTTVGMITIEDVPPNYADNRTWYDSASFATDAYGAWVVFKVVPALQALIQGLRY